MLVDVPRATRQSNAEIGCTFFGRGGGSLLTISRLHKRRGAARHRETSSAGVSRWPETRHGAESLPPLFAAAITQRAGVKSRGAMQACDV